MLRIIKDILSLIRVKHWFKNIFVFAPLLFAWKIHEWASVRHALYAFFLFCLAASAIYIINDIADAAADKNHPRKSLRPLPAGRIGKGAAACMAVVLAAGCLVLSRQVNLLFFFSITGYIALNLFYTFIGKSLVIIDAFCIAVGFVIRVTGGAFAIAVTPSGWIIMTTFFLSLFLGFGKRRNELLALKAGSSEHRPVLKFYSPSLLDNFILSSGTIAIISYTLYTISPVVAEHFRTGDKLVFTTPFVAYMIFRYMYLIWSREEGDPTDIVLRDAGLLAAGVLWLGAVILIIYFSITG